MKIGAFHRIPKALPAILTIFPFPALAASKLNTILVNILGIFDLVIGLLFAIATIVFFWGIVRYIASAGDEKAKADAKRLITWGIIGLAVMASAWGIARILIVSLDIPYSTIRLGY